MATATQRLRREIPDGTSSGGPKRLRKDTIFELFFSFSFKTIGWGLREFSTRKFHLNLTFKASLNNHDDDHAFIF